MALKIETAAFTSPTANGAQDVTIAGFGTPKAALIFAINAHNQADEPIDQICADGNFMVGFTDGTNERAMAVAGNGTGAETSDESRAGRNSRLAVQLERSVVDGYASFNSWITDGVRINWGGTPKERKYILVLFGGGDLLNVAVGTISNNTSHNLGFRPDVVFAGTVGYTLTSADGANEANTILSLGVVVDDGANTERLVAISAEDGQTTTDTCAMVDTNDSLSQIYNGSQSWGANLTIDADGFDTDSTMGSDEGIYLALRFSADVDVHLGTLTTPTTTGTDAVTGVGFEPKALFVAMTNVTAIDSVQSGLGFGFGVAAQGESEYSANIANEHNQAATDAQCELAGTVIDLPDDDGVGLAKAGVDSWDSDGFTLNYTTAPGTARYGWYLAIENPDAAGGASAVLRGFDYVPYAVR